MTMTTDAKTKHEFDGAKSGQVHWARWNPDTQILEIAFRDKNGAKASTYSYSGFTEPDWEAFLAADSKGGHFAHAIRGKFPHRKL